MVVLGLPGPCSYLESRFWRLAILQHRDLDTLLALGSQRFGTTFCVTACHGCQACLPARIPVDSFQPSRSQRRTWRRNHDLRVDYGPVHYTPEKFQLMSRFLTRRFPTRLEHLVTHEQRAAFYNSWLLYDGGGTLEFRYRMGGQLVGVGTMDHSSQNAYSHYFYYDPDLARRRLGIFSFLFELEWCRQHRLDHLYIGFYNEFSRAMRYKKELRPMQLLSPRQGWQPA